MNRNFYIRIFRLITTILVVILCSASTAFAAISGYVTKSEDGKYYEYGYKDLVDSYVMYLLGGNGPLYLDYSKKTMHAFSDDKNGYIAYGDVVDAYVKATLSNKDFDPDKYTAGSKAKKAKMPAEIYIVTLGSNGKVKYTKKILQPKEPEEPEEDILVMINKAATTSELGALVSSKAEQLGLELTEYNKLSAANKTAVLSKILEEKPAGGFSSLKNFRGAFNGAVEAVKPSVDRAMQEINGVTSGAKMKSALLAHDAILELGLGRCNLTAEEESELGSRIYKLKAFASVSELQRIVGTQLLAIRTGCTIKHSSYNYTLKKMLDTQMGLSTPPQTDLYGGGWKNAKRDDVAYYIDPYSFIDLGGSGGTATVRITADPNLKVRKSPTTASSQLKDADGNLISVWYNEVYAILGEAQAGADTAAGTEGTWYKIKAGGKEGWVCGKYCEVVGGGSSFSTDSLFQFLLLSGSAGTTVKDLNKILNGKGILEGRGGAFIEGSNEHNINEIFLASLALHETDNGKSSLAQGIEVADTDNLFPDEEFVTVYNMYGVGAYDSNPNLYGSQFAYEQRWFTPEAAIVGGAKFASERYVNHPTYAQNTIYKMRWNPNKPGEHQYATDMGWAAKQVPGIKSLYEMVGSCTLTFDIPRYKE
jgi:beta-N-acetylglucosaminidase